MFNWLTGKFSIVISSVLLSTIVVSTPVSAEDWPKRPITLVVPFPAGGINDTVGRLTADYLAKELDTAVIVENRPGAGGTIGTTVAVNSKPDGYTLLFGATSTIAVAPHLYTDIYDPTADLIAIGGIAAAPSLLVVSKDSEWADLDSLIAAGKNPDKEIFYGSAGSGTSHHVKTELLRLNAGTNWTHVPYRGGAPAMTDLLAGHIDFLFEPFPTGLSFVQSGRVQPIAISSLARSELLPDVPTLNELGLSDLEALIWFGLFAPAGTPEHALGILGAALESAVQNPDHQKEFAERGLTTYTNSSDEFVGFVADEITRWGDVITEAEISIEG